VWFPPGSWVDVFTGRTHDGDRIERLRVPLERMPVFARAGSVIPRQPDPGRPGDPLALDVYAGASGSSQLYEDAGEGFGYKAGEFARTGLRWRQGAAALTIGAARGGFPGQRSKRRYLLRMTGVPRPGRVTLTAAGRTRELRGWDYDPATRRLEVATGRLRVSAPATVVLGPAD
jgi:hypothetical protein